MVSEVTIAIIGASGVVIAALVKVIDTTIKAPLTELKTTVIGINSRIEQIRIDIDKHHSKEKLEEELRRLQDYWIGINGSEASTRLAMTMVDNVSKVFKEIAQEHYTMADFEKTVSIIEAVRVNSNTQGRLEYDLPEEMYDELDAIVERNIQIVYDDLLALANDDVFNSTCSRIMEIFIRYAKQYMKEVLPLLFRYNV
jgi:hypothetical protein